MNVQEYMTKSGIPYHLKGHLFVKELIEAAIKKPDVSLGMLEAEVIAKHKMTHSGLERRIRYAINIGYPNMDADIKKKIFFDAEKVSAGAYIKSVAYAISNKLI